MEMIGFSHDIRGSMTPEALILVMATVTGGKLCLPGFSTLML